MSWDSRLYGWYVTSAGQFEPIITLDDIALANLLWFVSCNCSVVIAQLRDVFAIKTI